MRVLEHWATILGDATAQRFEGATHPVWWVTADDGRLFVLKRLPEYAPGIRPVPEFRVLQHLVRRGRPVVVPVITDQGAISAPDGETRYSLLPRIRVDATNEPGAGWPVGTAHAIGRALAELHRDLTDYPVPIESFSHAIRSGLESPAVPEVLRERIQGPAWDESCRRFADLPAQRIQGDFSTGNLLLRAGRVAAFIDLDHLPLGPRLYDLTHYLLSRLEDLRQAGPDADHLATITAELIELTSGYQSVATALTVTERQAFVPALLANAMQSVSWHGQGRGHNPVRRDRSLDAAHWLCDHHDRLAASLDPQPSP